jgi:hypothetical protein
MPDLTFPRLVHQAGGALLRVTSEDAYVAALHAGWSADPVAVTVQKGDAIWVVYTADSLETALADGWVVLEQVDPEPVAVDVDAPARKRAKK